MELPICRNPAVGKAQYSDLSSGYTIYVTPLKMYTVHAVYSYLNTQNWKVLLIFTVKRFVSVAKNVFPHAYIFSSLFLKES